jgi:hypothetical protein
MHNATKHDYDIYYGVTMLQPRHCDSAIEEYVDSVVRPYRAREFWRTKLRRRKVRSHFSSPQSKPPRALWMSRE